MARLFNLGLLLLATIVAAPAWSQIYKWVDDDGVINYTNLPPSNPKAKKLDLESVPVSVIETDKRGQRAVWAIKSEVSAAALAQPVSVTITSPQNEQTVFDNSGNVPVVVAVTGDVQPDDRLVLRLDGNPVASGVEPMLALTGVEHGTHVLQAQLVDSRGSRRALSRAVTFNMWEASRLFPNRRRK